MTGLSDALQAQIFAAAAPLPAPNRAAFIAAVTATLAGEVGPGTVARAVRAHQREYWDPPAEGLRHAPKYERRGG